LVKKITLFRYGSALYSIPAVFRPSFPAVKIAPSESERSSFREMIKIGAFAPVDCQASTAIVFHFFLPFVLDIWQVNILHLKT